MGCLWCLCCCACCAPMNAKTMEIGNIICSSVAILLQFFGLIFIPWQHTYLSAKITYIISFIIFIFSLASAILLLVFRSKNLINNKYNKLATNLSLANFILVLIGIADITISDFCISSGFHKTNFPEEYCDDYGHCFAGSNTHIVSDGEYIYAIMTTTIADIIFMVISWLWFGSYQRIKIKTDGGLVNPNDYPQGVFGASYDPYGRPYKGYNGRVVVIQRDEMGAYSNYDYGNVNMGQNGSADKIVNEKDAI